MSQFLDCVNAQEAKDGLSPQWKKVWQDTYDAHFQGFKNNFGEEAADKMAGKAALDEVATQIKRQRYLVHLQKVKRIELVNKVNAYEKMDLKTPFAKKAAALKRMMEHLGGSMGAPFSSLEGRKIAIISTAQTIMTDMIEKFEAGIDANFIMKKNKALMGNIMKEMFGEDTGDGSAHILAKAWIDAAEYLRQRFNLAGGDIAKRANWGLPQTHKSFLLKRADIILGTTKKYRNWQDRLKTSASDYQLAKQSWIDFTKPLLDREKMIDAVTGLQFSDERLDNALSNMFDRITGEGNQQIDIENSGSGMKRLAEAHQDHRFLEFKDADSWLLYNEKFSGQDPYSTMTAHIDSMAREIAQLELLGPNPKNQWEWLKKWAQADADGEVKKIDKNSKIKFENAGKSAANQIKQADDMYNLFTGTNNSISDESISQQAFGNISSVLTGIQLGSAVIADFVSGPVMGFYARAFTGLSKSGDMVRFADMLFNPKSVTKAYAKRAGFISDSATNGLINKAYHDQLYLGSSIGQRLPDLIFKINGQQQFSTARKWSFGLEFMGALEDAKHMSLDEMKKSDATDTALATTLKNWGFKPEEWDLIRQTPTWEPQAGAKFLRMQDIETHLKSIGIDEKKAMDLSTRYGEMIHMEALRAVPENTLYARAATSGKVPKSSGLMHMITASMTKYRGFNISLSYYWGGELHSRALRDGMTKGAGTAASFLLGMTLAGAATMQLKEIVKGNTPRGDWDKPAFWQAAILQSGGLGIVGDFFTAAESRAGTNPALTALGPIGAFASDTFGIANDALLQTTGVGFVNNSGKPNVGKKVANYVARYTPISSIWYLRAAWDRAVIAHLRDAIDPNSDKYFQQYKKHLKDQEQDYWWQPAGEADLDYLMHHMGGVDTNGD